MRGPGANPAVRAVLERHALDYEVFSRLARHGYEHCLARADAGALDRFYDVLFAPGLMLAEIAGQAPPWPKGTRLAGQRPSLSTLSKIIKHWRAESTLQEMERVSRFVERVREKAAALPKERATRVTETLFDLLADEMVEENLKGVPLREQLQALDRLLAREKLAAAKEEVALARQKFQRETLELFHRWASDAKAQAVLESRAPKSAQLQALGRLMFGEDYLGADAREPETA